MTELDKLKIEILEEFIYFEERENIQFDEDSDFLKEIVSANSMQELENIRGVLNYNACLALLNSCKETIDYYSKIFTTTEIIAQYNDEFSKYVDELELVTNRTSIKDYVQYKNIFNKISSFNKRLKRNKNNFIKQSKWNFITKVCPTWFTIVTIFYAAIIGVIVREDIINNIINILLGWAGLLFIAWLVLRIILYPFKSPFNSND